MNKTKIDWCGSTWNPVTGACMGADTVMRERQTVVYITD